MSGQGSQQLTGRNLNDFKELAKLFESKNYKKGLKNSQKLLTMVPDHPDTMSMHAIFLFHTGEEDKGLAEAKAAVFKSKMKSQMCWHTYGMLLHQKRDYHEAIKCYQFALKTDPNNLQIMRDVALMQIQIRDHVGHTHSRFEMLKQKPNLIQNWLSYCMANHMKGEFADVLKCLTSIDTLLLNVTLRPPEVSSYMIYRCLVFDHADKPEEFYAELQKNNSKILDRVVYRELLVRACTKLNKADQAVQAMESLVKEFPDNEDYLKQYLEMLKVAPEKAGAFYKDMTEKYKSKVAQLRYLGYLHDKQQFKEEFVNFVVPYYKKNIISLFREVRELYNSKTHSEWMGEVFAELEASLKAGKYPNGEEAESPSEYLWSMFLKSQHLSTEFERLPQALELIDKCIAHTVTIPELYITKGKIHYLMHNMKEAVQAINEARKLDLGDRYLNNLCVKYLFFCGKVNLAEDMMRLFMKDESSTYELQNMWYEIEEGRSHLRLRSFGPGLRHLKMVHKQFSDMYEDQYDFHSYSLRKWNLREYLELVKYMDDIHNDRKYIEAAGLMLENLLELPYFKPEEPKEEEDGKKKKKKKKKVEEQLDPKEQYRKKIDYYGEEYLKQLKDPKSEVTPHTEALAFAKNVVSVNYVDKNNKKFNKLYFKAFSQSINVFIEAKKPLLCIKALKKLQKTGHCRQEEHLYTLKVALFLEKLLKEGPLNEITRKIVEEEFKNILQGASTVAAFHDKQISAWAKDYRSSLRSLEARIILGGESRDAYISLYKEEILKQESLKDTFTLAHKLEKTGSLTEDIRAKLNDRFGTRTTYFSNWGKSIDELPSSEWGNWWLSESDRLREQKQAQEEGVNSVVEKINNLTLQEKKPEPTEKKP